MPDGRGPGQRHHPEAFFVSGFVPGDYQGFITQRHPVSVQNALVFRALDGQVSVHDHEPDRARVPLRADH